MSTYVMSDLHGCYDEYKSMLEKIQFSDEDKLYILGDILDRGPNPIKIVLDLMPRKNVEIILGNHSYMAYDVLRYMVACREKKRIKIDDLASKILNWQFNGCATTRREFEECDLETQKAILDFMAGYKLYETIEMDGRKYILVHGGLGNFRKDRPLWDYQVDELVWARPDYDRAYFEDTYVISGHTPTILIDNNPNPGYIYKNKMHIAIDCGCFIPGGRLACLRLDDMKEFYVEKKE